MKRLIFQKPAQLFISILLPFLLVTIFIILTLTSVLYFNSEKIVTNLIKSNAVGNLESISNSAAIMKQTARSLAVSAFFDEKVIDILYGDIELFDFGSHIKKLDSYKNIYPFLHSIYVYNGHNFYVSPSRKFLYSKEAIFDKDILAILGDMKKYKSNSFISRRIPNTSENSANTNDPYSYVYTYLFYESQQSSGKISEAILLNISESLMYQYIKQFDKYNQTLYVVNDKGQLMLGNDRYKMLSDLSKENFIQKVINEKKPTDSFRMEADGADSYITYVTENSLNWRFISVANYDSIVKQIDSMRKITYLISGFILLVGIALTLFFSRRIYKPMKMNADQLYQYELEVKSSFYSRKQVFLNQLVKNNRIEYENSDKLKKSMEQFNITLDISRQLLIIACKIDRFSAFCEDYNLSDRSLMKYGIINIMSEIVSPQFTFECVDFDAEHIIILLEYNGSAYPEENDVLIGTLSGLQKNIDEFLKISVSFSFCEPFTAPELIYSNINKSLELTFHKFLKGHQCILHPRMIEIPQKSFEYPLDLEKQMGNELMRGHFEEAEELLFRILRQVSAYGKTSYNMSVLHVLISLDDVAKTICKNSNIASSFNCNIYTSKIEGAETLNEAIDIFKEAFLEINGVLEQIREGKNDRFGEAVIKIIHSHYMDSDLSINKIGEMLDLTPAYLGRIFRGYTSVPITDYINKVRIEKARELLITTNDSIADIMTKTGFISKSHFYNVFKSEHGVTPNQIRQANNL